jgi:hypothetical protein
MVAAAKKNMGKIPCPDCKQPVALMQAEKTGTLSYKCQEADCECTGFAQYHTAAARRWLGNLPQTAHSAKTTQAEGPSSKAPPKTPPAGAFSLGGL